MNAKKLWLLGLGLLALAGVGIKLAPSFKSATDAAAETIISRTIATEQATPSAGVKSTVTADKPSIRKPKSREQMAEAMYRATNLASQAQAEEMLLRLIGQMTPENALGCLQELRNANRNNHGPSQSVWNAFWRQWGATDGTACLEYLITAKDGESPADAVVAMLGWQKADPVGSAAWAAADHGKGDRAAAAWAACVIAEAGDDTIAITPQILADANTPPKFAEACKRLTDLAQVDGGAQGLTDWFQVVPDASKRAAAEHLMWHLMLADPQATVDFMTTNARASWREDRHCGKLIEEVSKQDPAGTAQWASTLYPSPQGTSLQNNPVYQATFQWARRDPNATRAWLEQNAQQPWIQAATAGYESLATGKRRGN